MTNNQSSETAVLVIDLYNLSFSEEPALAAGRKELLAHVTRLLDHAVVNKWHLFLIREGFAEDLHDAPHYARKDERIVASRPEMQFVEELHPYLDSSEEIIKTRHSAFAGTGLSERLLNMGVHNIVLVGVNTDICVITTAMTGRQDIKRVFIPIECVASRRPESGLIALELLKRNYDDFYIVTLGLAQIRATVCEV